MRRVVHGGLADTGVVFVCCVIFAFGFLVQGSDGSPAPGPPPSQVEATDPLVAGLPYPVYSLRAKGVTQVRLLHKVEPRYSQAALQKRQQGTVVARMVIDSNGDVARITVVRALGLGLDENAMTAVKQWKFTPAYKDGHAVASIIMAEVNFNLVPQRNIH